MTAGWTLLVMVAALCTGGAATSLQIRHEPPPFPPRHDGPQGRTTLTVRAEPGGAVLRSETWAGDWSCLGPAIPGRGYLVGGVRARGAWRLMVGLAYLPEDGGPPVPSAFERGDHQAFAAVASPTGRFVAFVGGRGEADLLVLDAVRDEVRRLGPAPLPPPAPELRSICQGQPFEWGSCWADAYLELEAAVLRFVSEDTLEVSLAKDGPEHRATKRAVRRYALGR